MIRLTIDIETARPVRDLERADMLWLANVKKGLIVDGVRITKITVKQMGRRGPAKKGA